MTIRLLQTADVVFARSSTGDLLTASGTTRTVQGADVTDATFSANVEDAAENTTLISGEDDYRRDVLSCVLRNDTTATPYVLIKSTVSDVTVTLFAGILPPGKACVMQSNGTFVVEQAPSTGGAVTKITSGGENVEITPSTGKGDVVVTVTGDGTGDMLAANNLSDLDDIEEAKDNLELDSVATTGDYDDLSNKPTLGTMAAEAAEDYLTVTAAENTYPAISNNLSDIDDPAEALQNLGGLSGGDVDTLITGSSNQVGANGPGDLFWKYNDNDGNNVRRTAAQFAADIAALTAANIGSAAGFLRAAPTGILVPTTSTLATAVGVTSATITNKTYGVFCDLTPDVAKPNFMIGWVTAVLVGDWKITVGLKVDTTADNDNCFGLFLTDGTEGEMWSLKANLGGGVNYAFGNGTMDHWDVRGNIDGGASTASSALYQQIPRAAPHFLRIVKSGTTRNYQTSVTGQSWSTIFTQSTLQTETHVGIGGRFKTPNSVTGAKNMAYVFHWENTLGTPTDIDMPPY